MSAEIFLNSKFVGTVSNGREFVKQLISERRKNNLPPTINFLYDEELDSINIETGKGRALRPLIVVKNKQPLLTNQHINEIKKGTMKWSDLVKKGIIEYLDAMEEESAYVAVDESHLTNEHTHLEIHPITILGIIASMVPYANFVQASRLNRGQKTQKQALGIYASNFLIRVDTDSNILHYPQVPLVKTIGHSLINYENNPAGQNVVVAIMSYQGYNMEDSIILNKASIQRGLSRSTYFKPFMAEEFRYAGGLNDEIGIPDKDVKGYKSEEDYKKLEDDGIAYVEAKLNEGDVVIGKTSPPRFLGGFEELSISSTTNRESSVTLSHADKGIADSVIISENEQGNKIIQVRMRESRITEVGDKFASRHGQKGVVGLIIPSEDMPFTASGIVPDLIFSPHSMPSRMTVSHMIEVLAGKTAALRAKQVDGTTFDSEPEESLRKQLVSLGFRENGTEIMYNGITGQEFKAKIFIGNLYYLKLKYMVANKIHARARGPVQLLTRQPTEGRAKQGGLRLGEMEKDCLVAHGASLLLRERFSSDDTEVPVCEKCGLIAHYDNFKHTYACLACGDSNISKIKMSYAFKLLLDELKSCWIYPKLVLKSRYKK